MFVHVVKKGDKQMGKIYNIADEIHAERIQIKAQKKRVEGSNKNFKELIEEEIKKEFSIEPVEEE